MDEAPTAACFICYNSSERFYQNVSLLQSKHSERSISAVLLLILCEELTSERSASNTICFECVDKINDYDEAFEKMNSIERELKHIHRNVRVKLEKEDNPVFDVCLMAEVDGMENDDNTRESWPNPTDDPFHKKPSPQSLEIGMSVDNHIGDPNCSDNAKSKIDYDQGLRAHRVLKHKVREQCDCSVCHKVFSSEHALEVHMTKHSKSRNWKPPFECEICGVEFAEHEELREHKTNHLDRRRYQCIECKYIGRTMELLKQHIRIHTHLKLMQGTETKPPPGECDYCGMDLGDAEKMAEHKNLHLNRPNFQCILCDRVLKAKRSLKYHMRTHVNRTR